MPRQIVQNDTVVLSEIVRGVQECALPRDRGQVGLVEKVVRQPFRASYMSKATTVSIVPNLRKQLTFFVERKQAPRRTDNATRVLASMDRLPATLHHQSGRDRHESPSGAMIGRTSGLDVL